MSRAMTAWVAPAVHHQKGDFLTFLKTSTPPDIRFKMKVVTWESSGARLYLDSRGLLHFKLPDGLEASMAMVGDELAFFMDGKILATPRLTGRGTPMPVDEAHDFFNHFLSCCRD